MAAIAMLSTIHVLAPGEPAMRPGPAHFLRSHCRVMKGDSSDGRCPSMAPLLRYPRETFGTILFAAKPAHLIRWVEKGY